MSAGTVSYIFIDGTSKWKNFIGTKYKYAINYLDNAIFNFDKCKSKKIIIIIVLILHCELIMHTEININ